MRIKLTGLARLTFLLMPLAAGAQPTVPGVEGLRSPDANQTGLPARPGANRELLLARVQERLALTAAQQELWRWFENRVDAYIATYYRQSMVLPSPQDAATHQVGRMVDNLQNRLAALEQVESATKSLYASLTPEQQTIANQLLIRTIPVFAPGMGQPGVVESRRRDGRDGRADTGNRPRRPGAGGFGGGMPPN